MPFARIEALDNATANRIAAGEVVERPSSMAKELLENALDAGATAITLEIREGGIDYLRVTDNGHGLHPSDVRLAFERHATSKIRSGDPLLDIRTLGFRGEALPSIAAVSRVELTSRMASSDVGVKAFVEGGEFKGIREAGCPLGTTIAVRDLFYNTPVRRKFLKRAATEAGYVSDIVTQQALCRPDVAFRFVNNSKTVFHTSGNGDLRTAVHSIYGPQVASSLIEVDGRRGAIAVHGLVGIGESGKNNRSYELTYLNRRVIHSVPVSLGLEEACTGLLTIGKYPFCILFVDVPYDSVDVNVHPNKWEVRFKDEMLVRSAVRDIVLEGIHARDAARMPAPMFPSDNSIEKKVGSTEVLRPQIPKPQVPSWKTDSGLSSGTMVAAESARVLHPSTTAPSLMDSKPVLRPISPRENAPISAKVPQSIMPRESIQAPEKQLETPVMTPPPVQETFLHKEAPKVQMQEQPVAVMAENVEILGVVFDTYLLVKQGERLLIMDQHAAHERLLYEQIAAQHRETLSQPMLTPYIWQVTLSEKARIEENLPLFEEIGFEIEEFGPTSFRVNAVPMLLGQAQVMGFCAEVLEKMDEWGTMRNLSFKRDALITMACKRAVKAGDTLSKQELATLLNAVLNEDIPLTCPHGRPIFLAITQKDLERRFKRV